ncbi:MAG: GNAT family N-acetyltransferase [Oscillospiraceae bacterium]|nr:GNAT family N-acetyltransferase [Oscillospiraceae bacterium]
MWIREMTIDDYDSLYKLWCSTPGMGLNDVDDSREGIRRYLERNPRTCFVAEEDGRLLGGILSGHDGRRGYIYHAAVDAAEQGRGIGRALAEAAAEALRREGISKAVLVAFDRNKGGNQFWEKCGFTVRTDLIYRNKELKAMKRIDIWR